MRKKLAAGLAVFLMLGLAGCESLPKKFIRKKKEPKHKAATVFLDEGEYQKQFSNEYYYKTHYTFWKTWHDDMLANLTGNSKKLRRAAQESYSHLEQMSKYLNAERQASLKPHLDAIAGYRAKFEQGNYSKSSLMAMRTDVERTKRLVANDFYFDKVKADILPDVVDLGSAPAAA
jgi:hypothetical protein